MLPAGAIHVTPELVLLVLVPGLVFEAALRLELAELRQTFGWMVLLAAPGVLVSAAIVAIVLNLATGLPFELGMVVGAMVAATDPVAVISTFRNLGAPRRLATLVEGESLFNDGTALVLFVVTVNAVAGPVTIGETAATVVVTVVSSVAIGLAAGWLASRLIKLIDDHSIELTISLATAYGTYLLTDGLHQSGIIATVVAGVVIGTYGRAVGLSRRALEALDIVWEFIAFLLTAFAFLLVGLAISFDDLLVAAPVDPVGAGRGPARAGHRRVRPPRRRGAPRPRATAEHRRPARLAPRAVLGRPSGRRGGRDGAVAAGQLPAAGAAPGDHVRRGPVHPVRAGHDGGAGGCPGR